MKTKMYLDESTYIAGMTLKDQYSKEENNMALHVAKDQTEVIENRESLAAYVNAELGSFVCANQTHSNHFYEVKREDIGRGAFNMENAIEDTDALYTYEKDIVLCTFTADCVPVLFYHETTGVIGAIHSGWQGTVKEITTKVLRHLIEVEDNAATGFHVYLGMALSQEKFEVDRDVYEQFSHLRYADEYMYYKSATKKYHIDNQLTVKRQCELAGVPTENIIIDRSCTFMNETGFSHREDRQSGRHLSFIMRK